MFYKINLEMCYILLTEKC